MSEANGNVFRVMLRMRIKPGMAAEFERVWLDIGESVTSHPANLGQWLSRADEDGVYYIVSDWVSEAGFRVFETSRRHLEHRQQLHPYRSGGSMTTMHVVAHLPGAAGGRTHEEWEAAR
ncbi:antibiotic biosynthesis monooxygenase [Actinosynnema sp. ALI-1.44]|uniref:antibiotic biosynthesis monooxygenase family protein n=1 Tax=Actinosynnema sp. ALI-1.44 TaxID=1933779 RepID=UPI00097C4DFD|nr:antibiotic biosynthesis monooxygenase family protein [Actinosynnema sp. ALI-1.44]ONI77887.1 antibiotic biosynthesis monooxygenase [Actinosynnema sp. ALI-1.44]